MRLRVTGGPPSLRAFDNLTEHARFIEALEEGLADAGAGRVHSHAEVTRRMKARYAAPPVQPLATPSWPRPR
jgi:hypothetical protein